MDGRRLAVCVPRTRGDEPSAEIRSYGWETGSVPRTRGDEPSQTANGGKEVRVVFPAHAGMNYVDRLKIKRHGVTVVFPRTRGDEPIAFLSKT